MRGLLLILVGAIDFNYLIAKNIIYIKYIYFFFYLKKEDLMKKFFLFFLIVMLLGGAGLFAEDEPRDDEEMGEDKMMDKRREKEEGLMRWRDDIARELEHLRMKLEKDFGGEERRIMEEMAQLLEEQLHFLNEVIERGEFENREHEEEVDRRMKGLSMRNKELWRELDRARYEMLKERALEKGDKGLAKKIKDIDKLMKEEEKLHKKLTDMFEKMEQLKRRKEELRREVDEELHEGEMR